MSEVKKIATRESYGHALVELGKEHEEVVVLDADLAEATKTGIFKKEFPERHIDCGISECNMMGIAAGLAATGKVPFASSFAMFAAGRAFEQIRNSIGYPHLNVKIGATHAGISVGEDGATHQCNEDIALMRTIPGMVVINPSDDVEARAAVKAAFEGETGKMVILKRVSDDPYLCVTDIYDVHKIANVEKKVPREWINEAGDYVTDEFLDYVRPLIQAELTPMMVDGLPRHLRLEDIAYKK